VEERANSIARPGAVLLDDLSRLFETTGAPRQWRHRVQHWHPRATSARRWRLRFHVHGPRRNLESPLKEGPESGHQRPDDDLVENLKRRHHCTALLPTKGRLITIDNYYEIFNGLLNPKQLEDVRL